MLVERWLSVLVRSADPCLYSRTHSSAEKSLAMIFSQVNFKPLKLTFLKICLDIFVQNLTIFMLKKLIRQNCRYLPSNGIKSQELWYVCSHCMSPNFPNPTQGTCPFLLTWPCPSDDFFLFPNAKKLPWMSKAWPLRLSKLPGNKPWDALPFRNLPLPFANNWSETKVFLNLWELYEKHFATYHLFYKNTFAFV